MNKVKFKYDPPRGDRRYFVDEEDVKALLSRLPTDLYKKLRSVYFKDDARGRRCVGYVTRGRRDIVLCALPPRISLSSYLRRSQNPSAFGAIRGSQWPTLAVRRFMLYDVFLHEIGHLQMINPKSKNDRRKFAAETKAQNFAEYWFKKLYSEPYDHPDPVHNAPSKEELSKLHESWNEAHGEYKKGLACENKGNRELSAVHYSKALDIYDSHPLALEALGIFNYDFVNSSARAIGLLKKAVLHDPTLHDANLFLGLSYSKMNNESEARFYFERTLRISTRPASILAVYARAVSGWGYWDEANKLFGKAVKINPDCPFVLCNFKIFLFHEKNPEREKNLADKKDYLDEKFLKITDDKITTHSRGLGIVYWHDK